MASSFLLLEDGASHLLLEDGVSALLFEEFAEARFVCAALMIRPAIGALIEFDPALGAEINIAACDD